MPLPLILQDGVVPVALDFMTLYQYLDDRITALPTASPTITLPRGYGTGCGLSNNGADATHDLDIAPGAWRSDDGTEDLVLAATLTKRLDATWVVGSAQGGLDTGTAATTTWYHVWLIKRPDTDVVDALLSTSATDPSLPANYTKKRRLGAVLTDGSAGLLAFTQQGDEFRWASPTMEVALTPSGTSANTITLNVPTGVSVRAFGYVQAGAVTHMYLSPLTATDLTVPPLLTPAAPLFQTIAPVINQGSSFGPIVTSTSAAVRLRTNISSNVKLSTHGWLDRRGRDE